MEFYPTLNVKWNLDIKTAPCFSLHKGGRAIIYLSVRLYTSQSFSIAHLLCIKIIATMFLLVNQNITTTGFVNCNLDTDRGNPARLRKPPTIPRRYPLPRPAGGTPENC